MAFHEVRFPPTLSLGALGGPERRVEIVTLESGHEARNASWAQSRRRYDAGLGLRSLDDLAEVVAFFEARGGALHGFRWKDWADYKSCAPLATPAFDDQEIGQGDGARRHFALKKTYRSGLQAHPRPITKPVAGSVRVGVSGMALVEGDEFEVDPATGMVTLVTAPGAGSVITAGFEFDVPVRFDTDRIQVSVAGFRAGEVPSVPVVEVRL